MLWSTILTTLLGLVTYLYKIQLCEMLKDHVQWFLERLFSYSFWIPSAHMSKATSSCLKNLQDLSFWDGNWFCFNSSSRWLSYFLSLLIPPCIVPWSGFCSPYRASSPFLTQTRLYIEHFLCFPPSYSMLIPTSLKLIWNINLVFV